MSHTLFVSDMHLCVSRPHTTQLFLQFLEQTAAQAEALYILGDLFEYWAGDDDLDDAAHSGIIEAMGRLAQGGVRLYVMHGNRDFLMGEGLATACGAVLLPDPAMLELYARRMLLTHGDALCTDDIEYQKLRSLVRNPMWQQNFLAQPLLARKAEIAKYRVLSEQEKGRKSQATMDINDAALKDLLRAHGYPELVIHGHTHRQGVHDIAVDGHACQRWVLGAWYDGGSALRISPAGCSWLTF